MANPFSNLPTPCLVTVGAKEYFANRAWDAVAFHVVPGRPVRISSFCHHCGQRIELALDKGKANGAESHDVVMFLGTPVSKWYDNLVLTCSNTMVFFSTRSHFQKWQRVHPGWTGEILSVEETLAVAAPISRGRAELDYQMPSRAELMPPWGRVGRTGKFWQF